MLTAAAPREDLGTLRLPRRPKAGASLVSCVALAVVPCSSGRFCGNGVLRYHLLSLKAGAVVCHIWMS